MRAKLSLRFLTNPASFTEESRSAPASISLKMLFFIGNSRFRECTQQPPPGQHCWEGEWSFKRVCSAKIWAKLCRASLFAQLYDKTRKDKVQDLGCGSCLLTSVLGHYYYVKANNTVWRKLRCLFQNGIQLYSGKLESGTEASKHFYRNVSFYTFLDFMMKGLYLVCSLMLKTQ